MPEFYVLVFDLKALFRLFPKADEETEEKLRNYEYDMEENMKLNREKLFCY